jgi:uncharacterized protein
VYSVFIDTSIWYAAADTSDAANAKAKTLLSQGDALATSDHIVIETWSLLRNRLGRRQAERFGQVLNAGAATVYFAQPVDLQLAWQIGSDYPDQDFSLVDRTSFALMLRLGLDRVASLDAHFSIFRFGPNRRRAFTVLGR